MSHRTLAGICFALVAMLIVADASTAWGQRPRSAIERRLHPGRGFWANQRAYRNMRHARDYSQSIYTYSRDAATIEPEVAKSESERLGQDIAGAEKELAIARKEAGQDKETLAALGVVEKHLAKAAEMHKALHEECCKDDVDGGVCAKHCSEITKELEKALAEQAALIRSHELKDKATEDGSR